MNISFCWGSVDTASKLLPRPGCFSIQLAINRKIDTINNGVALLDGSITMFIEFGWVIILINMNNLVYQSNMISFSFSVDVLSFQKKVKFLKLKKILYTISIN